MRSNKPTERNNSIQIALLKIQSLFVEQKVNKITIQKKYLPEIFSQDLLEISKNDGLPIIKYLALIYFQTRGVNIKISANEVQFEINSLEKQLGTKFNLIKLKDEQFKSLNLALEIKNEQLKTLEKTLQAKDEYKKMKTLEKTLALKDEQIKKLNSLINLSVDKSILNEKQEEIDQLHKEIDILNEELSKAEEDLESLVLENEKRREAQKSLENSLREKKLENSEYIKKLKILNEKFADLSIKFEQLNQDK